MRDQGFTNVSIKEVKEYWNKFPCNLGYSKNQIGTKEYFEEIEKEKYSNEPHILKFAEFEKWQGKKILEIGCGIGTDTINFAKNGGRVTAIDLSEKSLELVHQRAKVYNLEDKIKFYCGDIEELSKIVPVEPYDLIYSFGVIHHTPHPEKVIKEIQKYTKPGTVIKVMVYNRYSWPVFWILLKNRLAFWKLDELIAKYSESNDCPITYTYSYWKVVNLFKNFKDIKIKIYYPLSQANHFRFLRDKKWFKNFIFPIIKYFEKPFGWHICVTVKIPQL